MSDSRNVLGGPLLVCSLNPMTGFFRNGCCSTGPTDHGQHTVCVQVTAEFLAFSKSKGNDLTTAMPEYQFPGLKQGDRWCVCVSRWKEALDAGMAAPVVLESCHERALDVVSLEQLEAHAIPLSRQTP
jgi:uncharacterized protein